MRLYHVSDRGNIKIFKPSPHTRKDLETGKKYVWAIDEKRLGNYLLPRNCPRVCYYINTNTTDEDIEKYTDDGAHTICIEEGWRENVEEEVLYIYEFDISNFVLQDDIAGYYISEEEEIPQRMMKVSNLLAVLQEKGIDIKFYPEIVSVSQEIRESTFNWSCIRMKYALSKE